MVDKREDIAETTLRRKAASASALRRAMMMKRAGPGRSSVCGAVVGGVKKRQRGRLTNSSESVLKGVKFFMLPALIRRLDAIQW